MSLHNSDTNNMDGEIITTDADIHNESQWQDHDDSNTDIELHSPVTSPPSMKLFRMSNKDGNRHASFKINRRLSSHDTVSSSISIQHQLAHLLSKLEVMDERLEKTVTTNDLDMKLTNMVTRDEFRSFTMTLFKQADEEKQEMNAKIDNLQSENTKLKERLDKMETKVENSEQRANLAIYKANVTLDKCDDLEQHGRANTIRMYGTEDTDEYETEYQTIDVVLRVLRAHLGMTLNRKDIDIAHRMGTFDPDAEQSRSIICKFTNRTDKLMVIKQRKGLAGTGIVIKEDISQANRDLLNKVVNTEGVISAWTDHGKVLGKMEDGRIRKYDREIKNAIKNYEKHHDSSERSTTEGITPVTQGNDNLGHQNSAQSERRYVKAREPRSRNGRGTFRQTGYQGFRGRGQGTRGHSQGYRGRPLRFANGWGNWNPSTDFTQ